MIPEEREQKSGSRKTGVSHPGNRLLVFSGDGMIRRLYPGILSRGLPGWEIGTVDFAGQDEEPDGAGFLLEENLSLPEEGFLLLDLAGLEQSKPILEILRDRKENRKNRPGEWVFLVDTVVQSDPELRELLEGERVFPRDFQQIPDLIVYLKERINGVHGGASEFSSGEMHPTILVADDSRSVRNFVTRLLSGKGFLVETFENGQELLDYLDSGRRGDIILIDNQMPIRDGISTLQEIKAHPENQDTPVLFLSAIKDKETIVEALELGADDYMEKPFNNNEFFARINVHIRIQSLKKQIRLEKEKSDALLLNTLPRQIVHELKEKGVSTPETFENVTVYFSDIVDFTRISSSLDPATLIGELNEIFTEFDAIMDRNGCERIKTIGDAYLAVCGMPEADPAHAERMARAALSILEFLKRRNEWSSVQWQIRIGIHSGPVVGGIVGVKKYLYDVFGDTINTASRMESSSLPMRINASRETFDLLKNGFDFEGRGIMKVKGKGEVEMFFLNGSRESE